MKKKLLCAALVAGMSVAHAASAQQTDFDDRWYLTGSVGYNFQDSDRLTDDAPFGSIGLGKFVSPNWSLDLELNYQNPNFEDNDDQNWSQYGGSLDLRYHFVSESRAWNPYLLLGLGYQRSEEEYPAGIDGPEKRKDNDFSAKVGFGLQTTLEKRVGVRAEVAYRAAFDDQSVSGPDEDYFGDVLASVGVVIPLGTRAVVAPPPPPPVVTCADLDDDGDGVNNCDDKCPDSQPGQTIGPDGCPVPISIDLKGVNFDFDKATLRPDAVSILSEASEILKRYPELRVEVAGHTDSVGSDAYNQKLSERRAKTVYDYLINNGVSSSRLVGPNGFGESRPIDTNETAQGRAKNRRTELNVQN